MVLGPWYWSEVLHVMKPIKGLAHSIVIWPGGERVSSLGPLGWFWQGNEDLHWLVFPLMGFSRVYCVFIFIGCLFYFISLAIICMLFIILITGIKARFCSFRSLYGYRSNNGMMHVQWYPTPQHLWFLVRM